MNNFAISAAIDVRNILLISILINIFMWIKYTWMQVTKVILWGIFSMWFSYGDKKAFCLK